MGPRGGVVTQRSAKPCTPVQFWSWPPLFQQLRLSFGPGIPQGSVHVDSSSTTGRTAPMPGLTVNRPACAFQIAKFRDPGFDTRERYRLIDELIDGMVAKPWA